MNRKILRSAGVIGVAVLAVILFILPRSSGHKLKLTAHFNNAEGLRSGATVRLAGVEVGTVKSVRAFPEAKDAPVEVVMALNTPDDLKIPNDSTVSLTTAGVLGETFVEIDSRSASGPPIQSGATLKAISTESPTLQQMLDRFAAALNTNTTEQTVAKLEALIKERCNGDQNDSANVNHGHEMRTRKRNPGAN